MTTIAARVQLLAMVLLLAVSGPRIFDASLDVGYRVAHGVFATAATMVILWRITRRR
jgi:hypothetical protein